jgi:hypothetical protein
MTRTNNTNYTAANTNFQLASADTDPFDRDDVYKLARAVDEHTHEDGRGLPVKRLDSTALANMVLTGNSIIDDLLRYGVGANVASGSSINLVDDGVVVPITGTSRIITIGIKPAGTVILLKFTSAAQLWSGGNLNLHGPFIGRSTAYCALISNGASWDEIARANHNIAGVRVYRGGSLINLPSSNAQTISWDTAEWNYGPLWSAGSPTRLTPGYIGRWRMWGTVVIEQASGDCIARIRKNGSSERDILGGVAPDTFFFHQTWHREVGVGSITDYYEIEAEQRGQSNQWFYGESSDRSDFCMEYIGPL